MRNKTPWLSTEERESNFLIIEMDIFRLNDSANLRKSYMSEELIIANPSLARAWFSMEIEIGKGWVEARNPIGCFVCTSMHFANV